jgi:hypothetical protein
VLHFYVLVDRNVEGACDFYILVDRNVEGA